MRSFGGTWAGEFFSFRSHQSARSGQGSQGSRDGQGPGIEQCVGGCWLGRRYIRGHSWVGEGVLMNQKLEGYLGLRVGFWELDLTRKLNWDWADREGAVGLSEGELVALGRVREERSGVDGGQ